MFKTQIKTPYDLKSFYEAEVADGKIIGGHFFDRETMRFFGDTMKNYGLRSYNEKTWELYRRKPVKHGLDASAFFDKDTFKQIFNVKG